MSDGPKRPIVREFRRPQSYIPEASREDATDRTARIELLEIGQRDIVIENKKQSDLLVETRLEVGKIGVKVDVLPELVSLIKDQADRATEREHAAYISRLQSDNEDKKDNYNRRQSKRDMMIKVLGLVSSAFSGGLTVAILHHLGIL